MSDTAKLSTESAALAFLAGGGEMGERIRAFDWSKTPLGPAEFWSPALRMAVRMMLANRLPMLLWWGSQYISIYNDPYRPVLGNKHPWGLGLPVSECWKEIWHVLKPLIDTPFHGGPATWDEDILLVINRYGFDEETHWLIAYSPVPDESVPSGIGGVLATVHETTGKVLSERRLTALRDLGTRPTEAKTGEAACAVAARTLEAHGEDIPFALLYLLDADGRHARLAATTGVGAGQDISPLLVDLDVEGGAWPLTEAKRMMQAQVIADLGSRFSSVQSGPWSEPPTTAVILPIGIGKPHDPAGFLVAGVSSRLRLDEAYLSFLGLVTTQIGTAISTARAYEEERRRAESLAELDRAKTTFFSNVSHEFRTPLTLILGPLDDAINNAKERWQRDRLLTLQRNAVRLQKLVNTLLDFSRIEARRVQVRFQPLDLAALTRELASNFQPACEKAGLELVVECAALPEPVYVDAEMWEKIVLNLVSNAFKFTLEGRIEVTLRRSGPHAELVVRDTGVGIPADQMPRLFERFHRVEGVTGRTQEGSGIGLALVRELVRLHGGEISAESVVGEGTSFAVTVPFGTAHLQGQRIVPATALNSTALRVGQYVEEALRWLPDASPGESEPLTSAGTLPQEPGAGPPVTGERPRILVADDNADMRQYLRRLLSEHYRVEAVSDGRAALDAVRRSMPDLILSDVMMPRLDGFGLLREIRADQRLCALPVILLSARAGEESRVEGMQAVADDYLVKPFSARELLARVSAHLQMARLRRESERAVRESEERFRAFVTASSDVVYRMSADWSEMYFLQGRDFIADTHEPSRTWLEKYIDPEDRPQVMKVIGEAIRTKGVFQMEHRVRRVDATLGWTFSRAVPLLDTDGEIVEWLGAASDVTARKRAEEELQKERDRLRVTLASIGDAVITTDTEGRITFVNGVAESLIGSANAEAVGQPLDAVFRIANEDSRQPVENPTLLALKEGVVEGLANHTVLIAKDGRERPIDDSAAPIKDAQGRVVGCVLVFRDVTERRRVENEARRTQELLQLIHKIGKIGHWEWNSLTDENKWSPEIEALYGLPPGGFEGGYQGWAKLIHPDDLPRAEQDVRRALETGEYFSEFRVIWPDGSVHWLETRAHVFKDNHDKPVRIMGVNMDITERKQQEEKLRESERRFRQLADAMPQIVWTARPDGEIDYQNRRWYEFTGLPETTGSDGWGQILHPDDAPPAAERWAASLRSGAPFEMEVRLLDRRRRTYRWHLIRTVAVPDETGEVARWFGTSTDIHEQKRAEESSRFLAEASAALSGVVDYESTLQKVASLAVPYFADWSAVDMANEDGSLRRLAVAHQDPEKIVLVHELVREYPPDPQAPVGALAVLRTGKPEIISDIPDELLVQGAKDERHLHLIRSLGLKSYLCVPLVVSGETLGVLTFATAESGRRYTETDLALATDLAHRAAVAIENNQLYQALRDADRRKDEFLATLAHELRNPLAPIRNALQILKMPRVDGETAERSRAMMERQVHQLVRLVDDLLDVSRVMRGKIELRKERVELASVVARAVETVQPLVDAQGHQFGVRISPESLPLDGDPVRLAQVIGNLLTNAAKYTEPKGRIWLTAEREGDMAVLRVRDNGIGVAPQMLARIFELFVQVDHASTKAQGGLGIGLTLVKNLVQMHNGTVEARSAGLGQGSEFVVRLPLSAHGHDLDRGREVGDQPHQPPSPSGFRLLVVDDNQDAADSLAMLLRLQGHEVQVAFSGVAALEMTKTFVPDIVFLDIGMPGMDGYEVARRLRQQPGLENVVLAALTGWGQKEDRRRTAEAGFDHHLVKPPEPKTVESVLAELKPARR